MKRRKFRMKFVFRILLVICLGGQVVGCRVLWLQGRAPEVDRREESYGSMMSLIEPSSFGPEISVVQTIRIDARRCLYVSRTDIFFQESDHYYPILASGYPRIVGLSASPHPGTPARQ